MVDLLGVAGHGAGRRRRAIGALAVLVGGLLVSAGCFRKSKGVQPVPDPVTVVASNRGFFDVDVYVLPSTAGNALRLGTVTGFSEAKLTVRYNQLQAGGTLAVRLHGIGTSYVWDSPGLSVSPGERVALDIYTDADGRLSRSVLYPLPDVDSSALSARAAARPAAR
ncbi:MAG: hypothetical protein KGL38_15880 [Gemmatimonadota bacterium]|nr:hypothetical protein [Gemmatimonadota bacterium]